jgi:hypothetical protein
LKIGTPLFRGLTMIYTASCIIPYLPLIFSSVYTATNAVQCNTGVRFTEQPAPKFAYINHNKPDAATFIIQYTVTIYSGQDNEPESSQNQKITRSIRWHSPHFSPILRHPHLTKQLRHPAPEALSRCPHHPGVTWTQRCQNHHDLYPHVSRSPERSNRQVPSTTNKSSYICPILPIKPNLHAKRSHQAN